jgi:hypothetical protein
MHADILKILYRFEETGPGSEVPADDMDVIRGYVTGLITGTASVPMREAEALIRFLQWADWAGGWERGYDSGIRNTRPVFSLNLDTPKGS